MVSESEKSDRRILMLCNDRQIDRRILLQADSLQEAGWDVTILAMPRDEAVLGDDPRVIRIGTQAEAIAQRENRVLAVYRLVRRYVPMNGYFMRLLKSAAWRFVVDQERFYLNLFLNEGRRHPATVVVAHDLPMLAVGRALATEFKARLVYDSHELYCEQEFARWQQKTWAAIEQRHIHACDQVITVNPSIARELEKRYGLDQVCVIHNAERVGPLPERSHYLREHFGIASDQRILLFQGGLSAGRNLTELVQAMAGLVASNIHLVILGDGQMAHELKRIVDRQGLNRHVHFHPAVPQTQLLSITCSADAGVIPYQAICLNNYYCTPNKLFEFVSAGLPILASDLPELRRLVHEQQIGSVADLSTVSRLTQAISEFFSDDIRLQTWRGTLKTVRQEMSWQHEGEKLKQIYEEFR
ncbi:MULTISPECIES: glycosyltransferase family 4 protein [Pseudomonas]